MHVSCVHHSYLWFAQLAQYSSSGYGHLVSYSHGCPIGNGCDLLLSSLPHRGPADLTNVHTSFAAV